MLASLPQHSGRLGRPDRFHPPPSASISNTALAMRRPKMLTAVTSSAKSSILSGNYFEIARDPAFVSSI